VTSWETTTVVVIVSSFAVETGELKRQESVTFSWDVVVTVVVSVTVSVADALSRAPCERSGTGCVTVAKTVDTSAAGQGADGFGGAAVTVTVAVMPVQPALHTVLRCEKKPLNIQAVSWLASLDAC
jgi:hypothetical protein